MSDPIEHPTAKSLRQSLEMVADDRTACFEELGRAQARLTALEAENKALRDGLATSESWLDRWAQHVGNCEGEHYCTCGLAVTRYEARALLAKGDGK